MWCFQKLKALFVTKAPSYYTYPFFYLLSENTTKNNTNILALCVFGSTDLWKTYKVLFLVAEMFSTELFTV
jgi:hypothetical protein